MKRVILAEKQEKRAVGTPFLLAGLPGAAATAPASDGGCHRIPFLPPGLTFPPALVCDRGNREKPDKKIIFCEPI